MLWILISLFFCWLFFREFQRRWVVQAGFEQPDTTPVDKTYLALMGTFALLFAWPPIHYWHFERFLSAKATELAEFHRAKVHCNTLFDTTFDPASLNSGHANPKTGEIVFQPPWCATLMDYLAHPGRADPDELFSMHMFTHESMHVRGEYNEQKTDCEAIQRDYRAAKLLGVPDRVARKNARDYYYNIYMSEGNRQSEHPYFSDECAPGKAMDEHLSDSTWVTH